MPIIKDHMNCMYTCPHQRLCELHVHTSSSKTTWTACTHVLIKDCVNCMYTRPHQRPHELHVHTLIKDHMKRAYMRPHQTPCDCMYTCPHQRPHELHVHVSSSDSFLRPQNRNWFLHDRMYMCPPPHPPHPFQRPVISPDHVFTISGEGDV